MIKFYITLFIVKILQLIMKILKRNATYLPGKLAIKICPDFLGKIAKPKTIIAVTGTNGKTTVCNLLVSSLENVGYKVLNNRLGSNVDAGVASSLILGSKLTNRAKFEIAVLEIDERSSLKIYPYIKPTYLICTNLFRDSIYRNAHPQYIFDIINKALPQQTKLILNADDLISSNLGAENKKVYFSIDKQPEDLDEPINIINDIQVCPKCYTKLKYNYVRYHHIGNAYCPNCNFKSHVANYSVQAIDTENSNLIAKINGKEEKYKLISESMFNIYNEIAVIALLHEIGLDSEKIQKAISENKIVKTRYDKENYEGINIVSHVAKGLNPIACSCVFDYVVKEKANKEIVLILDDFFEAKESSENIAWIYETDFEFLNSEKIKRIVVVGKRSEDYCLRMLLAGIPKEKIYHDNIEDNAVNYLSIDKENDIYLLYDIYNNKIMQNVKEKIIQRIKQKYRTNNKKG